MRGEIIVWNVETKELIGYMEHEQNAKITALSWNIDQPDEIAFCDYLGQFGCIDVVSISYFIRDAFIIFKHYSLFLLFYLSR